MSFSSYTVPVGLLGLHSKIARVLFVIFFSISSLEGSVKLFSKSLRTGIKSTPLSAPKLI